MDKLKFTELNLSPEILKAVADMGFEETTPIQSLAKCTGTPNNFCTSSATGAKLNSGQTLPFGRPK